MNEQQLQQILTIQQAIAAAATAAVINSLLNPQQQQQQQQQQPGSGGTSSPVGGQQLDTNNRTAQDLLAHLQQQAAVASLAQQHQQQHNDVDQQDLRPDSRIDSPAATSSPTISQPVDASNQALQNLLMQLQQQAAAGSANPLSAISNASALAALNLNLNNQLPSQMPNLNTGGSPHNRNNGLGLPTDPFHSASPTTSGNMQPMPNSNKKLKRYHQAQPNQQLNNATSKSHSHSHSPKSHSNISNLAAPRSNNSSGTTNSSSTSAAPAFLPNNVGLPRKLVRGQDVWLGRGAEQTRQILKCMWCGQSFRTLAEMTQHMKVTQHYTNIISQEQITSWKQPDGSETNLNKQAGRQSNQAKMFDDNLDTSSEKFNDSDRDDSFSNEDEPQQATTLQRSRTASKSKSNSAASKTQNSLKVKRESAAESQDASETNQPISKPASQKSQKRPLEDDDRVAASSLHGDSDAENSTTSTASSQRKSLSIQDEALKGNDELNKQEDASSPDIKNKQEILDDERTNDSAQSVNETVEKNTKSCDQSLNLKSNGDATKSPASFRTDEKNSEVGDEDESERADEEDSADQDEQRKNDTEEDERKDNNDNCDKMTKKRAPKEKRAELDVIKQVSEAQAKGDGTGDPLSALETMVEKSFDPRMRPGLASGGILQRLGIDEEVCPPWQHINYANWYAAAAYGHPMAAALLAAGMNLQNGIKLSKNMNQKKGDE